MKSRSQRSADVAAHLPCVYENGSTSMGLRIGVVVSFFSNQMNCDQVVQSRKESFSSRHNIARVKWSSDHPCTNHIHESVIICATTFDPNVHVI